MSVRPLTTLAALIGVFGIFSAPPALAADGKAEGTVTVNGTATKLSHAYARAVKGAFDKTKEDVEVILSDVPLEGKALVDEFERIHRANAGKLHALEVTIDADADPISTVFRHNGFKGASPSVITTDFVFTKKTFDGKTVEGRYRSSKPQEFFGEKYSFDVAFRAAIAR